MYTHITLAALDAQLANRLDDASGVFWLAAERQRYLAEALRTFGVLSGFWRDRGTFPSVASTAFYNFSANLVNGGGEFILRPTVTDRDIILAVQSHLLEPTTSQIVWNGSEMFIYDDIVRAVERRRNQFLADTGIFLTRSTMALPPPPVDRFVISDSIIDVRRLAWLGVNGYYRLLYREDEFALTAENLGWCLNPDLPDFYSVFTPPPLTVQLSPPAIDTGSAEIISVQAGAALDPATAATVLGIPDDLTPFIKWGVLADLLGKDGQARDPVRAAFCEQRYQQGVQLARLLPCVLHVRINNAPVQPVTLHDLDNGTQPFWQNTGGIPTDVALAGWNMAALSPIPDSALYSITLDVVRNAPIPVLPADNVQIGREQLDAVLDYAEHLALFKVGGAPFEATMRAAQNFLLAALTYNGRVAANARYVVAPQEASRAEQDRRPRLLNAKGVGALSTGPQVPPTRVEVVNG